MDDTMNKMGDALLLRFKGINPLFSNARYRDLNVQNLCSGLAAAFLLYIILLVIYRLYLSPIAAFPGPKLAAATEWYELYYHLIKDGQFGRKVERMHEKYGPIVRISPWELSIRDSSFYNQIYVAGSTRRADMWARDSLHLSVPHGLHRQRRKHLEAFFSRQNIDCIEKVIADEAQLLDSRLQKFKGTGTAVHIDHAFTALTGDVIGRITCGTHPGFVEDVDFSPGWHELIIKTVLAGPSFRCFTWLNRLLQLVPCSILQRLYPKGTSNLMVGSMGAQYIEKIKEQIQNGNLDPSDSSKSVFHHLRTSDIPESEKSTARLQAESMIFLISGAVTSAHTLSMIVYHLLSNPHMEKRLREDLKDAMACYPAQNPLWSDLEKIPYLKACIKEALRLNGLVGNIARCSPGVEVQYKKWIIPRNTPVGMSIYHIHTEPSVWEEPLKFIPERWLGNYNPLMDRNFVAFTRGSRSCLGINLAMAELYITTAVLFRPGGPKLSLFETDESDIRIVGDFVMGFPSSDSRGVRVVAH